MSHKLLEVALWHHEAGNAVIAVTQDKRPYREGWNEYFTRRQTEGEVREHFSNGAYGVAMVLWPASPYAVLDFDGLHAADAWRETGIELPETALTHTRSGGKHLYFRMPDEVPELKRKVRVVKASCKCAKSCGVDLLVHGIAVIPPTPGYAEDVEHPLEDAVIIPPEILALAKNDNLKTETVRTGDATGRVGDGQRNATACSLAGTMRARGSSIEGIRAFLKADNGARYDPPLDHSEIESILKQVEKWAPGSMIEPEHLTDLGNARRLVTQYGQDLRYSQTHGWFTWTGQRWEQDNTGVVERLAKAAVRAIYTEAAACDDKDLREQLANHAHRSESDSRIKAMVALAKTEAEIIVKHGDLDADPWLLNVANGTLNLKSGELQPHNRADLITKLIRIEHDSSAVCPTWLGFLDRVMAGNQELIRFIQKCVGYSLTGSTREQCFFILYGMGANGKSTFIIVVSALLGDYAMQTRTESLMAKRGDQISNDIARLAGARFVSAIETEGGRRLAESLVKQMTGGDKMTARFLHHEFFEFEPAFKLWLAVNHKPRIVGTDHAMWRRIRLIPFDVTIPDAERDPDLADKLKAELAGTLAWAVQGCELWRMHRLKAPVTVTKATADYREESDPLAAFFDERCELEPHAEIAKAALYAAFKDWAVQTGEREINQRDFSQRIAERGFPEARNAKTRYWKGLRLADL